MPTGDDVGKFCGSRMDVRDLWQQTSEEEKTLIGHFNKTRDCQYKANKAQSAGSGSYDGLTSYE